LATDDRLRRDLLMQMGVSPQRLYQLARARKAVLPMSTEHAIYTLAHERGLDISKYLDNDETREVRALVAQLKAAGPTNGIHSNPDRASRSGRVPRSATPARKAEVIIGGMKVAGIPGLSPAHAQQAKAMAERVYPILYLFENSARDLIEAVMAAEYGPSWWETAVPKKLRAAAEKRKQDELRDAWHLPRGRRPIDYLLLTDLSAIVRSRWKDFSHLFPRPSWFEELVSGDMNVPRRVIAHMNPIGPEDVAGMEAAFRKWVRQLRQKEDLLP
jgi:hypothetical protein